MSVRQFLRAKLKGFPLPLTPRRQLNTFLEVMPMHPFPAGGIKDR
jgi:hypothetical protein